MKAGRVIFTAGLAAGALDIGFILAYYALKGVPAARVLQGVAAGAVGQEAAGKGGWAMAALGLGFHFLIALTVAAAFFASSRRWRWLVQRPFAGGLAYGVIVWLVMTLAVLPLTATPPGAFPPPQWIPVLIAHVACIGWPIAWLTRRLEPR
jgi:hypothetical protein